MALDGIEHQTTVCELPVTLIVTGGHRGSPGSFNPRTGGSPPEGPEVEFGVWLICPEGRGCARHKPLDITGYLDDDTIEGFHAELLNELEAMGAL
jgi:hypothetical protein